MNRKEKKKKRKNGVIIKEIDTNNITHSATVLVITRVFYAVLL